MEMHIYVQGLIKIPVAELIVRNTSILVGVFVVGILSSVLMTAMLIFRLVCGIFLQKKSLMVSQLRSLA
jgi:hypothetical protein